MKTRGVLRLAARESAPERIELVVERANHPDAVFNLRVIAVMLARGNSAACAQINLIAEKSEGRSESLTKLALQRSDLADRATTKLWRHGREPLVRVVARQSQRNNRHALDARVIGCEDERLPVVFASREIARASVALPASREVARAAAFAFASAFDDSPFFGTVAFARVLAGAFFLAGITPSSP